MASEETDFWKNRKGKEHVHHTEISFVKKNKGAIDKEATREDWFASRIREMRGGS